MPIYINNRFIWVLFVHVVDIKGVAKKDAAEPPLVHPSKSAGDCKAECDTFMRIRMQHEHAPGNVYTDKFSYIQCLEQIDPNLLT